MAKNSVRTDEKTIEVEKSVTLKRLFRYLLGYKGLIVLVLFVMAGSVGITLFKPLIVERSINVYVANKDFTSLAVAVAIYAFCTIALFFLVKARMYLMAKMSNDLLVKVRGELYAHLQYLSLTFFDSLPAGKILNRVIEDVSSLNGVLSTVVTTLVPQFVTLVAVLVIMFVKNWALALACLISFPLLTAGLLIIQRLCQKLWDIRRKKSSNLSGFIHEDVAGMKVIQSFAAEDTANESFKEMVREDRNSFRDAVRVNDKFGPVIEICSALSSIALYYTAVHFLNVQPEGVGTLIAYVSYASMVWQPISQLGSLYNQIIRNIAGANRIFQVLDMKPDVYDREGVGELPEISGSVEFKNVSFAYPDEEDIEILHDINFKIKPGETIALVGPTGAGKSTIVNLISRFYDIKQGQILIDGYDLKDVSINSLRRQMGVMTQDNFLFTGTIKENIRYGRLEATDEEIIAAAKAVNAHEFIMKMENGYDTKIAERGAGLSVGERQLLAFARTMVSQPKILILDEATSSIDTKTEQIVQNGIATLLKGRTSFVIAHRLSTIKNADRIFVVDKKQIIEAGSHEELMAKRGQYYDLYMAQTA